MNKLQQANQQKTINSREVAEMLGKSHSYVMKMIQRSGKILG